jgi:CHAT domain-containing protein/tetratricopeptide (TPR) repeat protein
VILTGAWLTLASPVLRAADDLPGQIDAAMVAGDFAKARPLAGKWLAELEKRKHPGLDRARAQQVLGSIEDRLSRHDAALVWLEKAWKNFAALGASPEERAACAEEAAMAAQSGTASGSALHWQQLALEQRLKIAPPNPPQTALTRVRLAEMLLKAGDLNAAAAEGNIALKEAAGDPAARCLVDRFLGVQAHTLGRWEEAVAFFSKAREAAPNLGPDAPAMQAALDGQTGQSLLRAGRRKEAGAFLAEAEAFFSRQNATSDEALAALNNLAEWWLETGEPQRAAERLSQSLTKTGNPGTRPETITLWLNLASAWHRLGKLEAAREALTSATAACASLPENHPLRAQRALAQAALARDQGDPAAARQAARDHARIALHWLGSGSAEQDEGKLLEFRRTMDPVSPLAAFAGSDPTDLAEALLTSKGRVLDLMLQRLLPATTQPAPPPGLDQVRRTLPPGAVLVDFLRWRSCGPGGAWSEEGRYGAMIIRPTGAPQWIDLGPANLLEERIRRLIAAARDAVGLDAETADRASLTYQLGSLWKMAWAPLAAAVEGASEVLIRPDAMLHYLPWAVLRDPSGRWFCDCYPHWKIVAYPRPSTVRPARGRWRVLAVPGAPSASMPDTEALPGQEIPPELWQQLRVMPALPGVSQEVATIRSAAGPAIGMDLPEANERSFAPPEGQGADVIHFAGHGFASQTTAWGGGSLVKAGLVMGNCAAGLQQTLAGTPPPARDDGILFTADAAALPLRGTRLIVLSGCETGLGQWQAGEHLTGLRHAFLTAGAGAVASTLWDLNDAQTPEMIRRLYQNLAAGQPPSAALTNAQRDWLHSPEATALSPGRQAALAGAWILESAGW